MSLNQERSEGPLTDKDLETLKNNVEMNGGIVLDPTFSDLQSYLKMNPLEPGASAVVPNQGTPDASEPSS